MRVTNSFYTNRHKLATSTRVINDQKELKLNSHKLELNEAPSQPLKVIKFKPRSGVCTGLTPCIRKRKHYSELKKPTSDSPLFKTQSNKEVLVETGIRIRRLDASNEIQNQIKKYIMRDKIQDIQLKNSIYTDFYRHYTPFRDSFLIIQKSNLSNAGIKPKKKNSSDGFQANSRLESSTVLKTAYKPKKVIGKVSYKEAMRDKEWVQKARPQILKSLCRCINKSNGMQIEPTSEGNNTYKYYLGKGNNSKLIKQCLASRWWWTRVTEEEKESANLVWTQWKDQKFIDSLSSLSAEHLIETQVGAIINTNIKYFDSESRPLLVDISSLGFNLITISPAYISLQTTDYSSHSLKVHNKIEQNYHLSNKKALFFNLKSFYEAINLDVFTILPVTFHIKHIEDPAFQAFESFYLKSKDSVDRNGKKSENLWIVKPGENSNRGNGISVCSSIDQIKSEIKSLPLSNIGDRTFIIQKYIENPYLINKRKFDIRCFALVTCYNGVLQGYFFHEGYLRTASKAFSLQATNKFIHLTNDAVQKFAEDYGKFESGNKMSYTDFQRYLDTHSEKPANFIEHVLPKIKSIVTDSILSVLFRLDPKKRGHCFEIFGYDFLLDADLKPWLLEVNTNPCLELSSAHLARIIPNLIENALRIALDPLFPEPRNYFKHSSAGVDLAENKFELIVNSCKVEKSLAETIKNSRFEGEFEVFDSDTAENQHLTLNNASDIN